MSIMKNRLAGFERLEGTPSNERYFYAIQQGIGCFDDIQAPQP